jgi:uncharacterized Zn finger protein (UPF0148 family)
MTNATPGTVIQRGRKCPQCSDVTLADTGDEFCAVCGTPIAADAPVVGIDADRKIVEVDGKPVSAASPLPTKPAAAAVTATVAPAPVSNATGSTATDTTAAVAAGSKKRRLVVEVDATTPRDGRPAPGDEGYAAPPTTGRREYDLDELVAVASLSAANPVIMFGRMKVGNDYILLEGDRVVSKTHGWFFHPEGDETTFAVQNESGSGTFVRGQDILVEKGQHYKLKSGDVLEVGDWFTITYVEE